jgi:hypothetical protein
MASDLALVIVGAASAGITAIATAGIPTWVQWKTDRRRFDLEQERLAAEAQRVAADRAAAIADGARLEALHAYDDRTKRVVDVIQQIVDARSVIVGRPTVDQVTRLRQALSRGVMEFGIDAADYGGCREWLAQLDAQPLGDVDHVASAQKLLDNMSAWLEMRANRRADIRS